MYFDEIFNNSRKLGLPSRFVGFNWYNIIKFDEELIKEGCLNDNERQKELEKKLIELQNYNYTNNIGIFHYLNKDVDRISETTNNSITKIDDINDDINDINDINDDINHDIDDINDDIDDINDDIDDDIDVDQNTKTDIKEKKNKKKNKKKKKKKKKKTSESESESNFEIEITDVLQEINTESLKRDERDEEYDNKIEKIKHERVMKKLKKRVYVKDLSENGDLDIIQANLKTCKNNIHEYFFHLREVLYPEKKKDFNFNEALFKMIKMNETKTGQICYITQCELIYFDENLKVFKLYVAGDDPKGYDKIMNATLLLSNAVNKYRETLDNATNFFKKTALAL